jgi:hypothetical protein
MFLDGAKRGGTTGVCALVPRDEGVFVWLSQGRRYVNA